MHAQTRHWLSLHERDLRPPRPRPPLRSKGGGVERRGDTGAGEGKSGRQAYTRTSDSRPMVLSKSAPFALRPTAAVRASYPIRYPIQWVLPNSSGPHPRPPPLRPLPAAEACRRSEDGGECAPIDNSTESTELRGAGYSVGSVESSSDCLRPVLALRLPACRPPLVPKTCQTLHFSRPSSEVRVQAQRRACLLERNLRASRPQTPAKNRGGVARPPERRRREPWSRQGIWPPRGRGRIIPSAPSTGVDPSREGRHRE